jgi:hypothetical protein
MSPPMNLEGIVEGYRTVDKVVMKGDEASGEEHRRVDAKLV